MTKLVLQCANKLTRYLSCSIFLKRLAPWTINMSLDRLFLEVLATVVALFWQTGKGGEWQVIWCLRRPQIIHDVGSLCFSTMWLFNIFLVKRTLKEELQVKETNGKKDQHTNIPSSTTRLSSLRRFGKLSGPSSSPAGTCRPGTGLLLPQFPKY